jgi:heterodisulfide reductase subunit C
MTSETTHDDAREDEAEAEDVLETSEAMATDTLSPGSLRLLQMVRDRCGVSLSECYQCRKCSAGCTMAGRADLLPHALIRMIQLGMEEEVLGSSLLWLCVSCQTCSTRCPNQIDFAAAVDALRQLSLEVGVVPSELEIAAFHDCTLDSIRRHGRMYELGMIARLKLRTGELTKDAGMGIGMFRHGKLRLFASNVKDRDQVANLFDRGRGKG